ncbi:MAG: AMP-binding protein [Gemmataceae bacterium]|jgi:acyl-[acyl-carrier-protein]-phospholipid O-acyltransferase/long-chain-fatty-acid--[acyl-carrier-protein] ligase|nr:AMP-binding protein [Gemmataceae bacterium]
MPLFAFLSGDLGFEWFDLLAVVALGVIYALLCIPFPSTFLAPLLYLLSKLVYRVKRSGLENIPKEGPVLLLSNHVTYIDWLLIWRASPRKVRFVAWAGWTKNRVFRWFLRVTNTILIDGEGGPRQLIRSLRSISEALDQGEVICLFPEGALSRGGGVMLPFRRGFEKILSQTKQKVPVIPVCLHQVWGSIFSYHEGKVVWKWPKAIPYRVHVGFGRPLREGVTSAEARLAIQALDAEIAIQESAFARPLHKQFIRVGCRWRNLRRIVHIDAATGTPRELTYGRLLVGSICLSRWLAPKLREKNVGIWLPTGTGGALANIAVTFLGRTSVNLNYTAGPETIRQAANQSAIKVVITSRLFLKKVPIPELEGVELIYLDDALQEISQFQRIRTMLSVILLPGWLLERLVLKTDLGGHKPDDILTIIFSSGSTGEPKGVMLSHRNVASNVYATVQHLTIYPQDRLVGVLPFFHSFGYTLLLWAPLVVEASLIYYPDPRAAKEIGKLTKTYKGTILLGTATFMRFYTIACQPDDFQSLRIIVCGAEKLPVSVAENFRRKFGILPFEGFGCTELSPVVAANVNDVTVAGITQIRNKPGTVGHPIPGVACRVVDNETNEVLPPGAEGMLQVKGPNVMSGYLNRPDLTAKVVTDGWYTTGDVAKIDEDGFVTITGRLSRFAKIGGEMVPLEKIEEDMHQVLGSSDRLLIVTSVADEKRGERLIVLTLPSCTKSPEEITTLLAQKGLSNLWIPAEKDFYPVSEIPILGTGKADLKRVKEMAMQLTGKTR